MNSIWETPRLQRDWNVVALEELAAPEPHSFVDGPFGSDLKLSDISTSGIPLVRIQHIGVGEFREGFDQFVTESKGLELRRHDAKAGDLVFAKLGDPAGRSTLLPAFVRRAVIVADCVRLRIDKNKVDPKYLAWAVNAPAVLRQIAGSSKGATRQRANLSDFKQILVPIPRSRAEQERIAFLLDRADQLRRVRRYAVEISEGLLGAVFLEMFGDPLENPRRWPKEELAGLCERFSDGPFGSNLKSEHYMPEGIRVIRLQNIGVGDFVDEDKAFISPAHLESIAKHECLPGDVLIGTLGDPNLRACIQPTSVRRAVNKADCVQARVDDSKANSTWLCALLNCPSTLHLIRGLVHGQTRSRVSMGALAELPVPVPRVLDQSRFAEYATLHDRLVATEREALSQAEHLFQTLLHEAFAEAA